MMFVKPDKYSYLIYRKLPKYIYIWLVFTVLLLILFVVVCCNYKYNKFYEINGLVINEGSDRFVQVLFEYDKLDLITNADLVLNREEKNFKYEIGSYFYSENSKAYKEVKLYFNHNFNNGEIINLNFKTPKTTIMKELKNKIKKGMG